MDAEKVVRSFGPAKWFGEPLRGVSFRGWFLLEINPLPPPDEIELVTSDIYHAQEGTLIPVVDSRLRHLESCVFKKHELTRKLKKSILDIEDTKFYVAVYEGNYSTLFGQPIAIALNPPINYVIHPNHPHLNTGAFLQYPDYYLPDSLCYTNDIESLGMLGTDERMESAFGQICIWLFRHQVWQATLKRNGNGVWIGPEAERLSREKYAHHLNPFGKCHCNKKNIIYRDCCMPEDYSLLKNCSIQEAKTIIGNGRILLEQWRKYTNNPQEEALSRLRLNLINTT